MPDEPGRQPEEDGRLKCLACGRWCRLLPPHISRAHSLTADDYRAAYRLPRRLSLRASDLNETAREQGLARYANRPDIRAAMAAGRQASALADAVAASQETARYELVLDARRRAAQAKRAAADRRMNAAAQAAGFPDMRTYLAARAGATVATMARELGAPRSTVREWIAKSTQP